MIRYLCSLLTLLLVLAAFYPQAALPASDTTGQYLPQKRFTDPSRIRYDGSCMTIEGRDMVIFSAAFHYFRTPKELWRDRFRKIKEAGFNTVETYIPWNWHERSMPDGVNDYAKFDFSELKEWLAMAHEEFDLYTIVRPGPYICAEWAGGGYPRWLAKFVPSKINSSTWLRSDDATHIQWSQHWYNAVCPILAKEQITHKPRGKKGIILLQLENEYVYFDLPSEGKVRYLKSLYSAARSMGIDVPMFTCVTPEVRSSRDADISQLFDMDNLYVWWNIKEVKSRMEEMKVVQPAAPAFICELQGGWFATVGGSLSEDAKLDGRHARGMALMALAGGSTGFNYYMFFGGTNLAGWGARHQTTTYDYGAPLRENGGAGEKYLAVKGVAEFINKYSDRLARTRALEFTADNLPADLIMAVRQAADGTKFIYLFNSSDKTDIDQPLTVRLKEGGVLQLNCRVGLLDSKVLVLPANTLAEKEGEWYPRPQPAIIRPATMPASVRVADALKLNEEFNGRWSPIKENVSLPEIGVNDARYVAYKSRFNLTKSDMKRYGTLVLETFTADPLYIRINGRLAERVSPDESNNVFDIHDLIKEGTNEVVALYENQGHKHSFKPMEELSGLKRGGLGRAQRPIISVESWEVIRAKGGTKTDIAAAMESKEGWEKIMLDQETISALSTLQIAGLEKPKWPAAWILQGVDGTALYRTHINFTPEMVAAGQTVLEFGSVDEQGVLFVNGVEVASHSMWDLPFIVDVGKYVKAGVNDIVVAVTNKYGTGGLLKPIRLRESLSIDRPLVWMVAKELSGITHKLPTGMWRQHASAVKLDVKSVIARKGNNIQPKGVKDGLFTWYKVEFKLPKAEKGVWIPWRMLVNASGNGYIWLNGHNIGRYWEIGPQREFFLPECWLKSGEGETNSIVFGLRQSENGAVLQSVEIAPYPNESEMRE